jgi:hypothetical protein
MISVVGAAVQVVAVTDVLGAFLLDVATGGGFKVAGGTAPTISLGRAAAFSAAALSDLALRLSSA